MGGHHNGFLENREKKVSEYPWSDRPWILKNTPFPLDWGLGQAYDLYMIWSGAGNKWWDPVHQQTASLAQRNDEQTGAYWYRRTDHIGERAKRVNKLPLSAMVDAERGAFTTPEFKTNYCNHLLLKKIHYERSDHRHWSAELVYWRTMYASCRYNEEKLGSMEHERMTRLNASGIIDAIKEKDRNATKFPRDIMYDLVNPQVIDFNRFRTSDNSWGSYEKAKASGEFIKNPQKPDQGTRNFASGY